MLGQNVDIFIMAGKRKQLSNDIKNVIVEMRKSGYKLQEITDTLNIPRGTVSDVVVSGPFHTLFPVNLSDPDFLLYNSPVVSFWIQRTLNYNNRIYIWRKKDEAESRDCVCPPAQRRLSVMIWGCISHLLYPFGYKER
jgi:hypothetical protein